MHLFKYIVCMCAVLLSCLQMTRTAGEEKDIKKIFSPCKKRLPDFDQCIKRAFNKLKPYFKRVCKAFVFTKKRGFAIEISVKKNIIEKPTSFVKNSIRGLDPVQEQGVPAMGVAPFDPHFAAEVRQTRSIGGLGYKLTLRDVYERGWSQSTVTKYKTDWANQRIIYSQYFPEKWLAGDYEFQGDAFGLGVLRSGRWNLTLRDYSQTTRIKRNGGGVDVQVEVDHIGDMDIHVGNLLRGRSVLEQMLDRMINASWKPGFAVIRPLINDLVSTAFTDIWSKSFGDFPIDDFIHN